MTEKTSRLRKELARLRQQAEGLLEQEVRQEKADLEADLSAAVRHLTKPELLQWRDIQRRYLANPGPTDAERWAQLTPEDRTAWLTFRQTALARHAASKGTT